MKNCSLCSTELQRSNTPILNMGKIKDGEICTTCLKGVNKLRVVHKEYTSSDLKSLLDNQPVSAPSDKNKVIAILVTIAIFGGIFLWIFSLFSSDDEPRRYTQLDALRFSEPCVKKLLKSPSSAQFVSALDFNADEHVTTVNDTTFLIHSWVESQNSFEVMLRTKYSCQVTFYPSKGTSVGGCEGVVVE